jgi:16S rRNA (adenine1518-N6/adenine1519-N6)-dimethyltransferase
MLLTSKTNVKSLLKKCKIHPVKGLGQNFLIDKWAVKKVIRTANLNPTETVLEIGPGIGTLTEELAKKSKKVVAVEKDQKMVEILKETMKDFKNVKVVCKDILRFHPTFKRALASYKAVGNLPFYLAAPVIRKFLEEKRRPKEMVLIVQKEVGQRICSKPPKMNILAVSVQAYAKPEIVGFISKKSFWPQPKVDSTVIKVKPLNVSSKESQFMTKRQNRDLFFKVVKAGFSQPRKQVANNLSKKLKLDKERVKLWLLEQKIKPTQRAETLSLNNWFSLSKSSKGKLSIVK